MKKLITIIYLLSLTTLSAQGILSGQIEVEYLPQIHYDKVQLRVKLYTKSDANAIKNSVNIHLTNSWYETIPKVKDTLISSQIRFQEFTGWHYFPLTYLGRYWLKDSVLVADYENVQSTNQYQEFYIYTDYYHDNLFPVTNTSPSCNDNFLDYNQNGLSISKQLNCIDIGNNNITYDIDTVIEGINQNTYYPISNQDLTIDSSGFLIWNNPLDTGNFLINISIKDFKNDPNYSTIHRISTIHVDSSLFSSNSSIEKSNYLQVFPNPATDYLTIKFDYFTPKDTEIEIFDMVGRRVHYQLMEQQNEQISLSNFANGVYVVRVRSGAQTWTRKIVKQ